MTPQQHEQAGKLLVEFKAINDTLRGLFSASELVIGTPLFATPASGPAQSVRNAVHIGEGSAAFAEVREAVRRTLQIERERLLTELKALGVEVKPSDFAQPDMPRPAIVSSSI